MQHVCNIAVSVQEASRLTGLSMTVIRKAIHTTDPKQFPPPLVAHRKGANETGAYIIRTKDLDDWIKSFPVA